MKKYLIWVGLLVCMASSNAVAQSGNKILAKWSDGWYVGTVVQEDGDTFGVIFDDGDVALVAKSGIRPLDWRAGTRVQCNWQGAGIYYWGTIVQLSASSVSIHYDDGDKEVTVVGRCRTPLE